MDVTGTPAGLAVTHSQAGWVVTHAASRLPLHEGAFGDPADLARALTDLAALAVDWTRPTAAVRGSVDVNRVRALATPPEQAERARRVTGNSTRYLRALQAAGQHVVGRQSHGLGGTTYTLSCGCVRHYTVEIVGPGAGEPVEDLLTRCGRHTDLVVEPASTDIDRIRRDLGGQGQRAPARRGRAGG